MLVTYAMHDCIFFSLTAADRLCPAEHTEERQNLVNATMGSMHLDNNPDVHGGVFSEIAAARITSLQVLKSVPLNMSLHPLVWAALLLS